MCNVYRDQSDDPWEGSKSDLNLLADSDSLNAHLRSVFVYRNNERNLPLSTFEIVRYESAKRPVTQVRKGGMLGDNIFVKKEIDSELAEEFANGKERLQRKVLYMQIWGRRWSPSIETFTQKHPILNWYNRTRLRRGNGYARIIGPLISNSCVWKPTRTRIPISDSHWRQARDNPRDSLDMHRDKSATVQLWNWNNSTVRRDASILIWHETVRRAVKDEINDIRRKDVFVHSRRMTMKLNRMIKWNFD